MSKRLTSRLVSHLSSRVRAPMPASPAASTRAAKPTARLLHPTQVAKTGHTCFGTFINSRWDCARGRSSGVFGHAPPRWRLSMRRSRGDRLLLGSVRGTSMIAICVAAISHVTPRRAGGESCVRWATSRSPAAGTLREGRKGCFCKKWIICAVRRIRQDEG